MPETAIHAPGKFCWMEIATTDKEAAKKFYSELIGWEMKDTPAGDIGTYTMMNLGGKEVGGLYQLNQEQLSQNVPPHWLNYVLVEDADKVTNQAESLGAQILVGPMDVMDVGRMSVLKDPQGAVFAVWQAKTHQGSGAPSGPGTSCWVELATSDTDAAGKFYSGLFGWKLDAQQMGDMTYTMFKQGEVSVGGMMALTPEMGEAPPNWLTYIAVEDCDATVAKAESIGGKVCAPPMDIPNMGRFSVLADPTGAVFAVFQFAQAE
jgi:predicted enzyme related to lactoylglutathione lyase